MADIKFSEFPKATQSKDSDEIAILQDGVNKMIPSPVLESKIINKTVSRVIQQGGASLNVINLKGVVPTYSDLALITPTPELNDAYQVEADGLVYVYTENGFQADGDGFVVQPEPTGVVEEGNTEAVSGGEVYKVVNPFTVRNHQLFDNSTMLTGYYLDTGIYNDSTVSWICTPLIPIDSNETDITASGFGYIPAGRMRFLFFNENRQFISSVLAVNQSVIPHTVTIPVGTSFVAVNVANVIDIGLDPTNSPYSTTFMLNYGAVALPWQEYGLAIDGTQIIGVQPEIQENIDNLENLKEQFESVTVSGNQLFNNNTMLTGYYTNTGAYVPETNNWISTPLMPIKDGETHITAGGYPNISTANARFVFFDESNNFISYVPNIVATTQSVSIPTGAKKLAVNVANAIDIGLDPTNSPYATTFMLNYGSEALPWEEYDSHSVYLDGTKIKGLVLPEMGNPMQFIAYNSTTKSFKHYQRDLNATDVYYMFEVRLNSSEGTTVDPIVYQHLWEVTTAKKCVYDSVSNQMTEQLDLIAPGESEFVFMCQGIAGDKVDHTGGIHGDERIDKDPSSFIFPFIDGEKVTDLNTDISLKSCSSFSYAQRSTLHETAEYIDGVATGLPAIGAGVLTVNTSTKNFEIDGNDTGVVAYSQAGFLNVPDSNQTVADVGGNWVINRVRQIVAGHSIMGEHFKLTYFENQGYRTINTLVTAAQYEPRSISYWYHGIYCLHRNASTLGFNEEFIEASFTGSLDTNALKAPKNRFFKAYNSSTGLSAEVTSRIIVESTNCKDGDTEMFVWDRATDSKYYRQTGSFLPITGEKQTSEMTVRYNYKE